MVSSSNFSVSQNSQIRILANNLVARLTLARLWTSSDSWVWSTILAIISSGSLEKGAVLLFILAVWLALVESSMLVYRRWPIHDHTADIRVHCSKTTIGHSHVRIWQLVLQCPLSRYLCQQSSQKLLQSSQRHPTKNNRRTFPHLVEKLEKRHFLAWPMIVVTKLAHEQMTTMNRRHDLQGMTITLSKQKPKKPFHKFRTSIAKCVQH